MLPSDITIDILSRLPAESIYQCKQVCKSWRSLINHDQMFTRMYQSRVYQQNNAGNDASGKISLIFSVANMLNCRKQFYYAKYAPHERSMKYTRINLFPTDDSKIYRILGSCNGLVCISMDDVSGMIQAIYICNPVTKEYLLLPNLCDTTTLGSCNYLACGFGYIPSTDEYKVVTIHQCEGDGKCVYVYTLGSGKGWRYIGEITYDLLVKCKGVFVNGALHWLENTQGNIVAFDLTEEKFSMISLTPTCFINNWPLNRWESYRDLQVLGGFLCIVHQYYDTWYDIWSLKKGNNGNEYSHWSKDFNTVKFGCHFGYILLPKFFEVTKDDKVLFFNDYSFYSHDLKQTRDNKLECTLDFARNLGMEVRDALLHVNSFISLKALGEDDTKIFELTELDSFDDIHFVNCTCVDREDSDLSICKKCRSQSRKGSASWVESGLPVTE